MKNLKNLSKRGLSLFLTLVMCLGMVQITAFAEESHTHNEGGWGCVYTDPVTEPDCQHEHDASCYVPGEDVLICEDESEDHEHTEDCYAPGDDVLNCAHECGEECVKVAEEGYWTCTAPVAEDEEPAEETPAEVKVFLDAVDGIPAITADNAEEVAEYVYGEVSEAYEALLGTEYEDRADVQEAVAAYAAAIEAVDAALDMESENYWGTYLNKTINAGSVTKYVGENGFYQRLPRSTNVCKSCGNVLSEYIPDSNQYYNESYVEFDDEFLSSGANDIYVGSYKGGAGDGDAAYVGLPCFQVDYAVIKPGISTVKTVPYYSFDYYAESGYCDNRWCMAYVSIPANFNNYYDVITFTVEGVTDYTVTYQGEGVTTSSQQVGTAIASVNHSFTAASAPVREGYTFKGWQYSGDGKTYTAGASVPMTWETSDGRNVKETMTAVWEEETAPTAPEAPKREDLFGILGNFVQVKCVSEGEGLPHDPKTYCTIGYWNDVTVGEVQENNGTYTCELTLNGETYAQFYGLASPTGTGVTHALKTGEDETKTVTLTWNANTQKWVGPVAKDTVLATFKVVCKDDPVPTTYTVYHEYYTNGEKDGHTKQENISGKNVGDTVTVAEIDKVLTYTKNGETNTYTYTRANKGNPADNPNGYTVVEGAITQLTLAESGNIIVLRYDRTTTPPTKTATYTVQWLNADNNGAELKNETRTGTVGKTVSVTDNDKTYGTMVYAGDHYQGTVLSATLAESGTVLKMFFKNSTTPPDPTPTNPKLTKLEKVRVTNKDECAGAPDDVEYNAVIFRSDDQKVKLLYKLTVTGTAGAAYKVTDEGAEWVSGGDSHSKDGNTLVVTGTIAEGKTTAVIYVTKEFGAKEIQNGKLTNNAELESNNPVNPSEPDKGGTEGPNGDSGKDGDNSDASEKRNVTINFKTDGGDTLQDSTSKDYDKGGQFDGISVNKPTTRKKAARASSETIVIPWTIEKDGKTYVLDEVASKDALEVLSTLLTVDKDVVQDIIYSLDEKGGNDSTKDEGGSDGIPDKYQVKVTFKVVNGSWNDETKVDVVKYVVKYKVVGDEQVMDADGIATLGNIIPAVGEKPDVDFKAGSWDTVPSATTEISNDTVYTYTYVKDSVPDPEQTTITLTYDTNGGSNAPAADSKTVNKGENATFIVKGQEGMTRSGYSFTGWNTAANGSGTPYSADSPFTISENTTLYAQWTQNSTSGGGGGGTTRYTLTVNYVYEDGTQAAPRHTERLERGDSYSVDSPVIEGFTPDQSVVSGTMPGRSLTVTVTYTANQVDIPEENPPLIDEPGTDDPTDNPPAVDIPEVDPPLVDIPEVDPPVVDIPEEDPPLVDIPEEDPPLVDIPENDPPLVDVPGDEPKLDGTPKTGDSSRTALWAGLCAVSLTGIAVLMGKKKEDEEA